MTRLEKIQMAIEKGITCDTETGKVYGVTGKELINRHNGGYKFVVITSLGKDYKILQHQFIYYTATGKIVEQIDHINGNKTDNRIVNLREATHQQNQHNQTKAKGYYWNKEKKKWQSRIGLNTKTIYLGRFDTEVEARNAYLKAKEIYHKI